ncbi:MAG TPA: hypothetical protein VMV43_09195 [Candidatus Nanopelagicaceae bacterium]|nr:hypothetical protein [Candidatus Nanopelagicaceae bacterium]
MSKIKKENLKLGTVNRKPKLEEKSAYRSVILSAVIGGLLLIISILLNGGYLSLFASENILFQTLDITIKVLVILFFFIFMTISIGNYKELTGKPLDLKLIVIIFIISLIQSFRDAIVFSFSFIGLLVIIVYLFLVQEN